MQKVKTSEPSTTTTKTTAAGARTKKSSRKKPPRSASSDLVEEEAEEGGSSDGSHQDEQSDGDGSEEVTQHAQCHVVKTTSTGGSLSCMFKHGVDFTDTCAEKVAQEFVNNLQENVYAVQLGGKPQLIPAASLVVFDLPDNVTTDMLRVSMNWTELFMASYHEAAKTKSTENGYTCVFICKPR